MTKLFPQYIIPLTKNHNYPDTKSSTQVSLWVYTKIYLFKSYARAPVMKKSNIQKVNLSHYHYP